jgi:hypothetical protein
MSVTRPTSRGWPWIYRHGRVHSVRHQAGTGRKSRRMCRGDWSRTAIVRVQTRQWDRSDQHVVASRSVRAAVVVAALLLATIGACAHAQWCRRWSPMPRIRSTSYRAGPQDASPATRAGSSEVGSTCRAATCATPNVSSGPPSWTAPGTRPRGRPWLGGARPQRCDDGALARFEQGAARRRRASSRPWSDGDRRSSRSNAKVDALSMRSKPRSGPMPRSPTCSARVDVLRFRAVQTCGSRPRQAATAAGRFDDARDAYGQAFAASPDSAFLYRDLAGVERRAAACPKRPLDCARQGLTLDPAMPPGTGDAGRAPRRAGRSVEGALAAFWERARATRPVVPADSRRGPAARARRVRAAAGPLPARSPRRAQVTRADLAALDRRAAVESLLGARRAASGRHHRCPRPLGTAVDHRSRSYARGDRAVPQLPPSSRRTRSAGANWRHGVADPQRSLPREQPQTARAWRRARHGR